MKKIMPPLIAINLMLLSFGSVVSASETNFTRSIQVTNVLVKRESAQQLVASKAATPVLSVETGGQRVAVPADLIATRCDFEQIRDGKKERTVQLVEFRVESKEPTAFAWSCFESANIHPHNFQVFASSVGNSYASYTLLGGIKLFRLQKTNDAAVSLRVFLESGGGDDAIPPLRSSILRDAVGKQSFYSENALYDAITVDEVTEINGKIRVALHGNNPTTQFTFELTNGVWKLVSQ